MVNEVTLIGNLGQDPEVKKFESSVLVKTTLATTEKWTTDNGEKKEKTEWHRLVFWGKNAEIAAKYLHKGMKIYVKGRIQYGEYVNTEGVKLYTTDIRVLNFMMLDKKPAAGSENQPVMAEVSEDELPF